MKKLFVIGVVCIVGLGSCRSVPCPAYTKSDATKSLNTPMVKANTAINKNRS